jgi:tetratricopeptide (TPR) repeat protein
MSKRKRTARRKFQKSVKPRSAISSQQNLRLQQASQAQMAGDLVYAESSYRALIAEKAAAPELFYNLALICIHKARPKEAQSLLKKTLALNPGFTDARVRLAELYQQGGNIDQAISSCQRVLSGQPGHVVAKYLLANLYKAQGKLKEASEYYEQIMRAQPDYTQAHFTYSGIHKYREPDDPHIHSMLELYQKKNLQAENRTQLAFALAKAFEDVKEYPQAFKYMEEGNRLRYETFNYAIDGDERLFSNIIRVFTREALSQVKVNAEQSDRPIFIVGMPRSGTSLVEKILASHSDVYGAGELSDFYALGVENFLGEKNDFQFQPLNAYSNDIYEAVGKAYLEKINLLSDKAKRITDKLPFNFMMIGLIKMALPKAKIIHCNRDARDVCLSVYKQNFTTQNYRFAYDLKTVGQFHNLYRMLMKHWHEVLPGEIYDIEYEALTQNPEHEIRNLLAACDLEWQDSCLDFDKTPGLVTTASFYQVRQPMYTSSVSLWQKYEEFLQPLLTELEDESNQRI